MSATSDNFTLGENAIVEDNVRVGFRYHPGAGPARIGKNACLRYGTLIYGDVKIGDFFQSGHYTVIRAKVRMGDYCTLTNHSTIEGLVRMGHGVRVMSHVYIPSRTWFGDRVFVGPGVTFLNDRTPGRYQKKPAVVRGATVEDDVMIGGGCIILPGVRIGARSFIAAGAVVNKDIPPGSFVKGVPGRVEPMPAYLDGPNDQGMTHQPLDLWHAGTPGERISALEWPDDWGVKFRDS